MIRKNLRVLNDSRTPKRVPFEIALFIQFRIFWASIERIDIRFRYRDLVLRWQYSILNHRFYLTLESWVWIERFHRGRKSIRSQKKIRHFFFGNSVMTSTHVSIFNRCTNKSFICASYWKLFPSIPQQTFRFIETAKKRQF